MALLTLASAVEFQRKLADLRWTLAEFPLSLWITALPPATDERRNLIPAVNAFDPFKSATMQNVKQTTP